MAVVAHGNDDLILAAKLVFLEDFMVNLCLGGLFVYLYDIGLDGRWF